LTLSLRKKIVEIFFRFLSPMPLRMIRRFTLFVLALGLVAGIASAATAAAAAAAAKTEATRADAAKADAPGKLDYILQPSDLIRVQVFQEEDLNREVRISQECGVNLPLIGSVDLTGKTARQAEELIRSLYERDYLVNPQVNLIVVEYVPRNVFVLGSVGNPGVVLFPREQGLTLLDAISRAGSFNRLADKKHVTLKRTNADGKSDTFTINAEDLAKGDTTATWPLQPNDVITVPERIL
jgi:polysaccharide export outer membrane protein